MMEAVDPATLETGILDLDGRVDRSSRPPGNAWKYFTLWKHVGADSPELDLGGSRAGMENHGSLYWLKTSHHRY